MLPFALLALTALAQQPVAPTTELPRPRVVAHRLAVAPTIDGRLDDAAWAAVPVLTLDRTRFPGWNAPASERTEVRVAYTPDALYVGARLFQRDTSQILAPMARRDDDLPTDRFALAIDSWHDRRTGYFFAISPGGQKYDEYIYDDNQFDTSWDGTWDAAVTRDAEGWSTEIRIPLSQLRFGGSAPRFGLNILRLLRRRSELQEWSVSPPDLAQFVSRFGDLEGLEGLNTPRRLEVLPYAVAQERLDAGRTGDPFHPPSAASGRVGADLRMGIGASLTLTAAINPDFGQVDGDPAEVNLQASELFRPERRPFFAEGDAFRVPLSADRGDVQALLYSRRIGRAPQGRGDARGGWIDAPATTSILGAAKLTGKTAQGWNVGGLAALTGAEHAQVIAADGTRHADLIEPGTLYAAGRVGRDFRGGRTLLGAVGTLVHRDLDARLATDLRRDALVGGVDVTHRWGPGSAYQVRAAVMRSHVAGDAAAILTTQRASTRYLQRPDFAHGGVDSSRTALDGTWGYVKAERRLGDWLWTLQANGSTPGFEANDLGFHYWAGRFGAYGKLQRQFTGLSWASRASFTLGAGDYRDGDLTRITANAWFDADLQLRNHWSAAFSLAHRTGGLDVTALRGGPGLRSNASAYADWDASTDGSKRIFFGVTGSWTRWYDGTRGSLTMRPQVTWRPSSRTQFTVGTRHSVATDDQTWIANAKVGDATEYLVSEVTQRTMALTLRSSAVFTPTLSLQLWAEPFTSSGHYRDFRRVTAARADRQRDRFASIASGITRGGDRLGADVDGNGSEDVSMADPDFTSSSFQSNLVLRWEFRPSSTLFLVWQQQRTADRLDGSFDPTLAFSNLRGAPPRNLLAAKVTWWWAPR